MNKEDTSKSNESKSIFGKLWAKFQALPSNQRLAIDIILILIFFSFLVTITPDLKYSVQNVVSSSNVEITVIDSTNGRPIMDAKVSIGEHTEESSPEGVSTFENISFGEHEITVEKDNYDTSRFEYIVSEKDVMLDEVKLDSNGKRIDINAKEYLSNLPVDNFIVSTVGNNSITTSGSVGAATLVVPNDTTLEIGAEVMAENFQNLPITLNLRDSEVSNDYTLIPNGKNYFLASRGDAVSIYESNVDGSDQKRILEPNGQEAPDSKLFVNTNGSYAVFETSRRQEIVDGVNLKQLYKVDLHSGEASEFDSGAKVWKILDINDQRVIYQSSLEDPGNDRNHRIYKYEFQTNRLDELFATRNISFVQAVNGKVLVAEQIERGSYPGGYLLRQLIAIDENTKEQTIHSKDATITDMKVVTPTKIQYNLINPRTKAEVKFVYDTNLDSTFQASVDRTKKRIKAAPFADVFAWTVNQPGRTTLAIGNSEGEAEVKYQIEVENLVVSQWLDDDNIILKPASGFPSTNGVLINLKTGETGRLP